MSVGSRLLFGDCDTIHYEDLKTWKHISEFIICLLGLNDKVPWIEQQCSFILFFHFSMCIVGEVCGWAASVLSVCMCKVTRVASFKLNVWHLMQVFTGVASTPRTPQCLCLFFPRRAVSPCNPPLALATCQRCRACKFLFGCFSWFQIDFLPYHRGPELTCLRWRWITPQTNRLSSVCSNHHPF